MATLNYYIKKVSGVFKTNSKGKSTLLLQYNHNSKVCYFSTGVQILPEEFLFHKEKNKLKHSKTSDEQSLLKKESNLNREISKKREYIQTKIDELIFEDTAPSVDALRDRITSKKQIKLNYDLHSCFEYFKTNKSGISTTTMRNYQTMYATLTRFLKYKNIKTININEIDYKFYTTFCSWMEKTANLQPNSIGERIKRLKSFLNYHKRLGFDICERLNEFEVFKEPKTIIYCDLKEIQKIIDYDFSQCKRLEKVRDIFIVGCHTGLRVSDLLRLSIDDIRDGLFRITTRKTGKEALPPVSEYSLNILNKYDGRLPEITDVKYNVYLKEMAQEVGLDNLIEIL